MFCLSVIDIYTTEYQLRVITSVYKPYQTYVGYMCVSIMRSYLKKNMLNILEIIECQLYSSLVN